MYFPHDGPGFPPIRSLYANKCIPSIYSRHVRHVAECSVGLIYGVPLYEMRSSKRRHRKAAFARQVAMYLAHVAGGLSLTEVGRAFGRDRTTVAHACAVVEDARDDVLFDRSLAYVEMGLEAAAEIGSTGRGGAR